MGFKSKLSVDRVTAHIGRMTLEIYWPALYKRPDCIGVSLPTKALVRLGASWKWTWAACIQLAGFGFGVCLDHCDNPFRKELDADD